MRENIERGLGLHASSRVLLALVERGGLRARTPTASSSATPCAPPTSACRSSACSRRTRSWPRSCRWPSSTPASTTRRCCATCPRSSRRLDGWRSCRATVVLRLITFLRSGKVRDLYRVGDDRLLLVASDRLSAFDVVLPTPIPDKGRVLTGLSRYWFAETAADRAQPPAVDGPGRRPGRVTGGDPDVAEELRGRMMLGRLAEVLPDRVRRPRLPRGLGLEGVPRRRRRLRRSGSRPVCGRATGCRSPIFTPATKAPHGRARREHPVRRASRR